MISIKMSPIFRELRDNTERTETIDVGANMLAAKKILELLKK